MEYFKAWLTRQNFSISAKQLFQESFLCYSIDAHRASLLFGYLGMVQVVRERISSATPPKDFQTSEWEVVRKKINDGDSWERETSEILKQKKKVIFVLTDEIDRQLAYWRDRRNDCAHAKDNKISAGHVVAFYNFIESNLPKIVVNGSKESLIQRIKDHFDTNKTMPDTPVDSFMEDINHAIISKDLEDFFEKIIAYLYKINTVSSRFELIHLCIKTLQPHIKEACINVIKKSEHYLVAFLRAYPDDVGTLNLTSKEARPLWKNKLLHEHPPAIISFLMHNVIEKNEYQEVFREMLNLNIINISFLTNKLSIPQLKLLQDIGFYNFVREFIYDDLINNLLDQFRVENAKYNATMIFLWYYSIDQSVAESITKYYNHDGHISYLFRDGLNNFFQKYPKKIEEFYQLLNNDTVLIPKHLTALHKNSKTT